MLRASGRGADIFVRFPANAWASRKFEKQVFVLYPLSYSPMVGLTGLEPVASRSLSVCMLPRSGRDVGARREP